MEVKKMPIKEESFRIGCGRYIQGKGYARKCGEEVAFDQLAVDAACAKIVKSGTDLTFTESEREITVSGDGFSYSVSKIYGELSSMKKQGRELLLDRVKLTVMRAPLDNERRDKVNWYKEYNTWCEALDRIFNKCYSVERNGNVISVSGSLAGVSRQPFLRYTLDYTFFADGSMKLTLNGNVRENCIWLPRLGFELKLPYANDKFTYFGRGPLENYSDMKSHLPIGFFDSTADGEYVNYVMPQERGNHTDTKLLELDGALRFEADKPFEFNVSHYSSLNLMRAMHIDELKKEDATIVRIDYKDSGVGSHSCGPMLPEKYQLCEKKIENFEFYVQL